MSHDLSFIGGLIRQKENLQIEFMGTYQMPRIMEVICSLLNSEGGWLLIGYNGKEFHPIGGDLALKVEEIKTCIVEQIFPQPLVDVRLESYKTHHNILINVIKGSRQPYSYEGKYYIRLNNNTKEATEDEISLLMRTSNEYISTWEKQTALDATLDDLMQSEIETTIGEAVKVGRGKSLPNDVAGFLNYFQLINMNLVRNGCVLLFGKDPNMFIPQSQIRITVMHHGKTGSRFEDTVLIQDNLFVAFNRVQEYFTRNLPMVSEFKQETWNRINREKYPMDALDEGILNAMVHRDYGDVAGDITINIYPEKIEITNSGAIPPDIITGKSKIREHHSVLRNPTIAHMFYLRGKIEKLGRGLSLIRDRFHEYGLKLPEWTIQNGYTTLTLYGFSRAMDLNERIVRFIKNLKTGENFTRNDFEKFFEGSISEKTARNDIARLLQGEWISKIGDGPSTSYIRSKKELPESAG